MPTYLVILLINPVLLCVVYIMQRSIGAKVCDYRTLMHTHACITDPVPHYDDNEHVVMSLFVLLSVKLDVRIGCSR